MHTHAHAQLSIYTYTYLYSLYAESKYKTRQNRDSCLEKFPTKKWTRIRDVCVACVRVSQRPLEYVCLQLRPLSTNGVIITSLDSFMICVNICNIKLVRKYE